MASAVGVLNVVIKRWKGWVPIRDTADNDTVAAELRAKITAASYELSSIIPDHLLVYCSICSDRDIRLAQMLLKEILLNNKKYIKYCIENSGFLGYDVVDTYYKSVEYPIMTDGRIRRKYERLWEEQHTNNSDRVNTREYWIEVMR